MENQPNFEEQLYQFRYLKEQRVNLQGQLDFARVYLNTLLSTKKTLDSIKDGVNVDDEILVPIGGLVNIKASIKDTEKFLVTLGQDTLIEKNLDESIEYVEARITRQNENTKLLIEEIQKLDVYLQGISQNLQNNYNQIRKQ